MDKGELNVKWFDYVEDKLILICINLIGLLLLSFYLKLLGIHTKGILLIDGTWVSFIFVYLLMDYHRRSRFFRRIEEQLKELKEPLLLADVMEKSPRYDDRFYYFIIRRLNKLFLEELRQKEDEKKELADYMVNWVHEAKVPLTSLELISDGMEGELKRKVKGQLKNIEKDVEEVLYFARSDQVYQDYLIKKVDLKKNVYDAVRYNKDYFIERNISVDIDIGDTWVYSDSKWLLFILGQILINAAQYQNKDKLGHVKIEAIPNSSGIKLLVADNGIGISKDNLPRIFDKGFTGDAGRNHNKATGIGLYLCKKLCNQMGIIISAQSEVGKGSTFTLFFPKDDFYMMDKDNLTKS